MHFLRSFGCSIIFLSSFALYGSPAQTSVTKLPAKLPPHPRVLFRQADVAGIKERAAGACKEGYAALKQQADEWLSREIKLPNRGGQWFHWYSCPKHGARLRTESPTHHVCPVDQEVLTGYPYDDVVVSTEHNRLASAIRTLGIVYQIGGDRRHADKAREILLAYAAKYQEYPLHNIRGEAKVGGGKIGPQTLDESTWLITTVEGADCIWQTLSAEERGKVTDGLLRPATTVIRDHKMGIHNIQCWKNSAVGVTALLLEDSQLLDEAINGPVGFHNQLAKGITADGPWFERRSGYHFYTVNALLHLTEAAHSSGIDLYNSTLKRMFDAPLMMAQPDLSLPAFNDSHAVDLAGSASVYQTALARYNDASYSIIASKGRRDGETALLRRVQIPAKIPVFASVSRNFTASGNAILSAGTGSDATWLCMKYGPHGGGHGHPDKLNFVLYGLRELLAPDPGTANYGVPIQAGWYRTTLAHNTLTVDETSQQAAEGKCRSFLSTNGFSAVMAEAGKIYPGVQHIRTVALVETNLVVVLDQVRADRAHVFDLAYHNRGGIATSPAEVFAPPEKPGYSYLRDARATNSDAGLGLRFDIEGGKSAWWSMAGGQSTKFIVATGVGRHTEDRIPLVIARREAVSETAYLWCVYLGQNGHGFKVEAEPVQPAAGKSPISAVRVKTTTGTLVIVANPDARAVHVGGQEVSARIALLQAQGGQPLRVQYLAQ